VRHFKGIVLALIAVFAGSAVAASAASAEPAEFISTPAAAEITAKQVAGNEHVFTVGGGTVKCKEANFTDKAAKEKSGDGLFRASYGECTAFGLAATVSMHNCEYELLAERTAPGGPFFGKVNVVNNNFNKFQEPAAAEKTCPAPATQAEAEAKAAELIEIHVTSTNCKVWVGKQSGLNKAKYVNVNGETEIEQTLEVEKIKAFSNGKGLGCPAAGAKEGTYTGKTLAKNTGVGGALKIK
jgi:hypothetical protein